MKVQYTEQMIEANTQEVFITCDSAEYDQRNGRAIISYKAMPIFDPFLELSERLEQHHIAPDDIDRIIRELERTLTKQMAITYLANSMEVIK